MYINIFFPSEYLWITGWAFDRSKELIINMAEMACPLVRFSDPKNNTDESPLPLQSVLDWHVSLAF